MFKPNEKVVMLLACAGVETASIQTVSEVKGHTVFLDGISTQSFHLHSGRPLEEEIMFGTQRRIVPLEK
jgi:hypothetical protein